MFDRPELSQLVVTLLVLQRTSPYSTYREVGCTKVEPYIYPAQYEIFPVEINLTGSSSESKLNMLSRIVSPGIILSSAFTFARL